MSRLASLVTRPLSLGASLAVVVALHCGSDDPAGPSSCTGDENCPAGTYCTADGKCTSDCSAQKMCQTGLRCTDRGRCEPDLVGGDGGGGGDSCVDIQVTLSRPIPNIILLVDRSGSMDAEFGSGTRWSVLKNALLGSTGILQTLAKEVSFGLTMYGNDTSNATCPDLLGVPAAVDNFAAINAQYSPAGTIPNTPTGESVLRVLGLTDAGAPEPNGFAAADAGGPKILILATDGDPDSCADPTANDNPTTQQRRDAAKFISIDAVKKAFTAGVRTYVIAVGDEVSEVHQQEVANVGLGFAVDAGDAAPFFRPADDTQLATTIRGIVTDARSCKFALNGTVQAGDESKGVVTLNGQPLTFGDPNGWQLNGASELEVKGTACNTVKTSDSATLSAKFPCGSVTIIR